MDYAYTITKKMRDVSCFLTTLWESTFLFFIANQGVFLRKDFKA